MTQKKHWTQTPEGKARMSAFMKKSHAAKRAMKSSAAAVALLEKTQHGPQIKRSSIPAHLEGFAAGHCNAWLEVFAHSHKLSITALKHRVGAILQAEASGPVLGTVD